MFDGIGLGLTVRQLGADARSSAPGHRRARLSEVLPIAAWSDAEKAFELTRIQQARAMLDARWREPLDAMLRWLGKVAAPSSPSS